MRHSILRVFFFTFLFIVPLFSSAESIDQRLNNLIKPVSKFTESLIFYPINIAGEAIPIVVIWLFGGAVFFTIYLKFLNITAFKHALDVVRGKYDDPNDKGEVSHFQALTAALSGTVGVGNIAGVAIAISVGGPGAMVWMILGGLFGMSSKFLECSLGVKYRNVHADNSVSGGPMYYISKGFANRGWNRAGYFLAFFFAITCIGGSLGGGNMIQINQATKQFINVTGDTSSFLYNYRWVFGVVMAILVGLVIIGGIRSIVKITDKIVPLMVAIYVGAAIAIILISWKEIPTAFYQIYKGAFDPDAAFGGIIGVLIIGIRRAAFSNEAGVGSASIAHSAAKTNEPISEGIVALLEPFIDTVVICTMTALVIIITNSYSADNANMEGVSLTSEAFGKVISWFPMVLSFAVILFAISTMISWSYYGLKSWTFIFGESRVSNLSYKLLFCIFIVLGSSMDVKNVFDLGDAMIFAMCFPNVLALFMLAPEIKKDTKSYFNRIKNGEIKKHS